MQKKYVILWLTLLAHAFMVGCNKTESKVQFRERQRAQKEMVAASDAIHAGVINLVNASRSFDLVSQPRKENSSPERIFFHREWLLSPSGTSTPTTIRDALITSCESLLHRHIPSDTDMLNFDVGVEDEEGSIRMNVDATWMREPEY